MQDKDIILYYKQKKLYTILKAILALQYCMALVNNKLGVNHLTSFFNIENNKLQLSQLTKIELAQLNIMVENVEKKRPIEPFGILEPNFIKQCYLFYPLYKKECIQIYNNSINDSK